MVTTPSSLNTAEDLAADLLGENPPGGEAEEPFRAPLGWDWMAASYILPPSPWVRIVVICYLPPGQTGSLSQKVVWRQCRGEGGVTRILSRDQGHGLVPGHRGVHRKQIFNRKQRYETQIFKSM